MRLCAFLRAINVGGHVVTMERLRREFEALRFQEVETFIASGNVLFTTRAAALAAVERKIEAQLLSALGYEVKTFLRTGPELESVAGYQPFDAKKRRDAGNLNVGFLAAPLEPAIAKAVEALSTEVDELRVHGREVYWLFKAKQTETLVKPSVFQRTLKVPVTFRTINTVTRLAAKLSGSVSGGRERPSATSRPRRAGSRAFPPSRRE